jgi:hypothetical protein
MGVEKTMQHEDELGGAPAEDPIAREPQHVPLAAMLSERERRRAAERKLESLKSQPFQAPPMEDAFEALNSRFHRSENEARARHGGEAVDAARAWTERRMRDDPHFARAVMSHRDPYAYAVERHAAEGKAEPPENSAPTAAATPRSLVSAPSAGGAAHVPVGPGQAFDALFNR